MATAARDQRGRLLEMYQSNLDRQIQQGDCNPVCRNEELCKEVEALLSKGPSHEVHFLTGLDPLSVMEASLQAQSVTSGKAGLERLAKAFEVLELAALNLYLWPWRKEYRVVKMFSGMFTHYVKPALTSLQAKEMFGLLGYEPGGTAAEEQLELASRPVHAISLLQLAYTFFTARVECRLLLCSVASLGRGVECELQLVRERRHSHSLQVALDSARRKLEPTPQTSNHNLSDLDVADLYTDQNPEPGSQTKSDHMTTPPSYPTESGHMTAPPNYPYIPPEESLLSPSRCYGSCPQSEKQSDENNGKAQTVCVSTMAFQISPKPHISPTQNTESSQKTAKMSDNEKQVAAVGSQVNISRMGQQVCSCIKSYDPYVRQCVQCRDVHTVDCPCFRECRELGHELRPVHQNRADGLVQDNSQNWEKPSKDTLKTHSCMNKSKADIFVVCHDCNDIHDFMCEDFKMCQRLRHSFQHTGRLKMPQGERGVRASPERHSCLSMGKPVWVVCQTCDKSHDYLCEETWGCQRSDHVVTYEVEQTKGEACEPSRPMPLHSCCIATMPDFACLTCKVFHTLPCSEQCLRKHKVCKLLHICAVCTDAKPFTLCKYCCVQYCKACWFKNPMNCRCGKIFDSSSV